MASCRRLSDGKRYGIRYDSDAVEMYSVEGLSSDECCGAAAQSLTPDPLPAIGAAHPVNPNLSVYDVQLVNDIGSAGGGKWSCIVAVIYRPINWAGAFRPRRMRQVPGQDLTLIVPIIKASAINESGEAVFFTSSTPVTIARRTSIRTESRTTAADENEIVAWFNEHVGKILTLPAVGSIPPLDYQILQPSLVRDAANVKYLDINLLSSGIVPAIPAGFYEGQDVALPFLPPLAEWNVSFKDDGEVVVNVIDPRDIYGVAPPCPYL